MALDQTENFVRQGVTSSVGAGDTTINVSDASDFPDPSNGNYNCVIWDTAQGRPDQDSNVEIVRVTGRDTGADTLTVTRAQESTSAVSHPDTSALILAPTAKMFSDIEGLDLDEFSGANGTADEVPITDGTSVTWSAVGLGSLNDTLDKNALDGSAGTDGQVWTSTGSAAQWEAASSGGSATEVQQNGSTITADVSVLDFRTSINATETGSDDIDVSVNETALQDGGSNELDVADLAGGSGSANQVPVTDGAAVAWETIDADNLAADSVGTSEAKDEVLIRQANIPLTEIPNGDDAVGLQKQVPSGKTLSVWEMGVQNETESARTGLNVTVQDLTNAVNVTTTDTKHLEGSPIATKSGTFDAQFRVENDVGGTDNASAYVLYSME